MHAERKREDDQGLELAGTFEVVSACEGGEVRERERNGDKWNDRGDRLSERVINTGPGRDGREDREREHDQQPVAPPVSWRIGHRASHPEHAAEYSHSVPPPA